MNLLLQLLPYATFAAIAGMATAYYVMWSSRRRRAGRPRAQAPDESVSPTNSPMESATVRQPERLHRASGVPPAVVSPASPKTQIVRLRELGVADEHIAAALQVPLQEVQVVLNLDRRRHAFAVPAEKVQPSIVE